MKITKRQLRRIIKEEKAKLLRESIADMNEYVTAADDAAMRISEKFGDDMMKLYEEEPDALFIGQRGAIEKDFWEQQVAYAQQEIDTAVSSAILRALEEVETRLHDGQYFSRGR